MYSVTLDSFEVDGKVLRIPGIRDRGYVQIGDVSIKISPFFLYFDLMSLFVVIYKTSVGVLYRGTNTTELTIDLKDNDSTELYIIVENMGRLNFGDNLLDSKVVADPPSEVNFLNENIKIVFNFPIRAFFQM